MKKKLTLITVATAAMAIAYRAAKGYGVFNRMRFSKEHQAISDYLASHHPGATYGPIAETGESVSTVVSGYSKKFILVVTKSDDGIYIFSEEALK